MKKIIITMGDPNGISPEITIKALNSLNLPENNVILVSNKCILDFYRENYSLKLNKNYQIIEVPFKYEDILISKETKEAGEFSFNSLLTACDIVKKNIADAIVTAPVSKHSINLAGYNFSGQTEILEKYLANEKQSAEMLFVSQDFFVFLLTRHIPFRNVPDYIKKDFIINKVEKLNDSLIHQLGIKTPKLAICALNPHAGECSMFGNEEEVEIIPAIHCLKNKGINIDGPFPSDSLFANCLDRKYDCYIALYHDQGLIPMKLIENNKCVNTTIGLNILRTSPAHGTAFDIAGKNIANPLSMINAVKLAARLED